MSRESSFGVVGFKSEDYSVKGADVYDDSYANKQLEQANMKRRGLEEGDEEDQLKFKIKKKKSNVREEEQKRDNNSINTVNTFAANKDKNVWNHNDAHNDYYQQRNTQQ